MKHHWLAIIVMIFEIAVGLAATAGMYAVFPPTRRK
jgi:hypothetical protein